ncbi:unnamed protein product [Albugo candida]|uniref:RING-type domain-containing protein n=1 Tax=Albugo candida TaxID=65357 RepID=A0A024G1F6_9STRA|nr:unnamed protein product [Albugo candida]|eukprot:CCI40152.1 unnamed protein product [Albugo candida]
MDTEIRASNYIIMQRDKNASKVQIPAVFISYRDGEKLLLSLLRAYPWETVRVTLDDRGKMSKVSSSPWATKRVMTYAFAVSTIWLLSSCVSVLGSFLLDYLRQYLRKRAARILPVLRYHKKLRAFLIAEKAKSSTNMTKKFTVLDRMLLTAQSPSFRDEKAWLFSISINDLAHYKITSKNPVDHARAVASSVDLHLDAPLDDAEYIKDANSEHCAICLERFEFDELVKVLPCSHYFHQDCINPWLEKKSEVCPLCRQHVIITSTPAIPLL